MKDQQPQKQLSCGYLAFAAPMRGEKVSGAPNERFAMEAGSSTGKPGELSLIYSRGFGYGPRS